MERKKTSALPEVSALTGAEIVAVVQENASRRTTVQDIRGYTSVIVAPVPDASVSVTTTALQELIDQLADDGGGILEFPAATYIVSGLILKSNVTLRGAGHKGTTIKLADGANANVIETLNFATLAPGSVATGAPSGWGIIDLRIDGNKSNNASPGTYTGHGIAAFGNMFLIDNVYITDTVRSALYTDFAGTASPNEPYGGRIHRLTLMNANEHGWYNGVSDCHADDINVRAPGSGSVMGFDGIHCAANGSIRGSNFNVWSSEAVNFIRYGIAILGDGTTLTNIHVEASGLANLYCDALYCSVIGVMSYNARGDTNIIWSGNFGKLEAVAYPGFWAGTKGVQIGETGSAATANLIDFRCTGMIDGALVFNNSGGANKITVRGVQTAGTTFAGGTQAASDTIEYYFGTAVESFSKFPTSSTATAAAGTSSSANATVLPRNVITATSTATTQGVRFPSGWANRGALVLLTNGGANAFSVYPHTAGNFQGLAANVAVTLPAGATMLAIFAVGGWGYILS